MSPDPSVLIEIADSKLHEYMQSYPFLTGPNPFLNRQCLVALRDNIKLRHPEKGYNVIILERNDFVERNTLQIDIFELLVRSGIAPNISREKSIEFGHKVVFIPQNVNKILSIGCGSGFELTGLRARLPHADIYAIDWEAKILGNILEVTKTNFQKTNFYDWLDSTEQNYDAIFSNHVIEHFYHPNDILRKIRYIIRPGGIFIGSMPLDGDAMGIFYNQLLDFAKNPDIIKVTDLFILNVGHPWKTNIPDLASTLQASGFSNVEIFQRSWQPTVGLNSDIKLLPIERRQWERLHSLTCRPMQQVVSSLFGNTVPRQIVKILEAIERRLPFGTNRLSIKDSPEITFVARV